MKTSIIYTQQWLTCVSVSCDERDCSNAIWSTETFVISTVWTCLILQVKLFIKCIVV